MLAANADVRTNWGAAVLRRYKNKTKRQTWVYPRQSLQCLQRVEKDEFRRIGVTRFRATACKYL